MTSNEKIDFLRRKLTQQHEKGNQMNEVEEMDENVSPYGTRLDRRTLLSLMAAVILAAGEDYNVKSSVDAAFEIDRAVGDKIRLLKNQKRQSATFQRRQPKPLTPDEIGKGA